MRKFWNTKKASDTVGELILYGDISDVSWWGDEVTPKQLSDDLKALGDVSEIHVRINSGGGDVFAGVAIHSMLKRHSAKKTVYIDGLAASIASIIAMVGEEIIMPKGSMMMIHNPSSICCGEAKDFRKLADTLDTVRDSLLEIYRDKTGMENDALIPMLDATTWMTATEAVEKKFATKIEETPIAASIKGKVAIFNGVEIEWSRFTNAPKLIEDAADPEETVDPLTDEEITAIRELLSGVDDDDPEDLTKTTVTQTRNLDLEAKSLFLIENTI